MTTLPMTVPAFGVEEHYWIAEADGMASRAQMRAASGAYESSVPPRIADLDTPIPGDLAADIDEATAALTRFDVHAAMRLGESSPVLGPMSSILLRTESTSSSRIENLTVGAYQLALAEIGQSTSENARLVAANVRTMEAAIRLSADLSQEAILAMHRTLLADTPGWESHAGQYRNQLVWIGTSNITPRGAAYIAPQPEHVQPAMTDLVAFLDRDDMPAIAQAAIAHAHFETIHPFADGNGRTGRALVHAALRNKGVVTHTTAPVSAGLLTDTTHYFAALTSYRQGDARPIIERFTAASRYAATTGLRLVNDLAGQLDQARHTLEVAGLRPQATAFRVLPILISNPVITARLLCDTFTIDSKTAQRAITQLAEAGIIDERTGRKKNRVWRHVGILTVLDAYAQNIDRRTP
ncbi:MAG: Fic family protein [Cellulomonadaceae bacterium]|nr:Fic family protein [Cellulomonadaceae bacterium]